MRLFKEKSLEPSKTHTHTSTHTPMLLTAYQNPCASPFFCCLRFIYLSLVFWLRWIFVAAWELSLSVVSGATLHCGAWVSHCNGLSGGARALGARASVVVAHGSSPLSLIAPGYRDLTTSQGHTILSHLFHPGRGLHVLVRNTSKVEEGRGELNVAERLRS